MLAPEATVVVSALTQWTSKKLSVVTRSTILIRVGDLAPNIVLTVFACVVLKALTQVAVSLVNAFAVVQTDDIIFTSSRVGLAVKQS